MQDVDKAHKIAIKAVYEHYALQKVHELAFLLCLLQKQDTVVEIGCDAGGTSWAIEQMGVRRQIGIDLPGDRFSSGLAWQGSGNVDMIWGDSHAKKTKEALVEMLEGESMDILIIDGDHTYDGVADDFRMYGKLCTGLIIFHDICHHADPVVRVDKFYQSIMNRQPHVEYISPFDNTWGGIGVIDVSYSRRLQDTF